MATKKAASSTKNGRDSNPRYLGIKLYDGEKTKIGSIIVRQAGYGVMPGKNVRMGKDYTIFAMKEGTVKFASKRQMQFDKKTVRKNTVSVI